MKITKTIRHHIKLPSGLEIILTDAHQRDIEFLESIESAYNRGLEVGKNTALSVAKNAEESGRIYDAFREISRV